MQRRKGRVRRAGGPQPRARDTGRSARPSRLLTASPGCRAGAAGKHGGHLGPGFRAWGGPRGLQRLFPPLQARPKSLLHTSASRARGCPATLPTCSWGENPQAPQGEPTFWPLGRATSRPSEGTLPLVSGTTRNTGTRTPSAPGEAQGWGHASETPAGPSSPLHWGGCYASLCSWWPPRLTKPSSGGVR